MNENGTMAKGQDLFDFAKKHKLKIGKIKDNSYEIIVVKAFQRKFRQNLINGKIDQESL